MRCPNCNSETGTSGQFCYYCGTPLQMGKVEQPASNTNIINAYTQFVKSPLVLTAIIAFTVYAGITLVEFAPMLKYFGDFLKLMEVSFFLSVSLLGCLLLFVPPVIIAVGLWQIYKSSGYEGTETVRSGIRSHVLLSTVIFASLLLAIIFTEGATRALADSFDELLLPLAYFIYGVIAVSSMRKVVDSLEYTVDKGRVNTDGVQQSGIMLLVYLALTLLSQLKIVKELDLVTSLTTSFSSGNDSLSTMSVIAHMLAIALFSVLSLMFHNSMTQAEAQDNYCQKTEAPKSSTAANPYDDTTTELKRYKELADTGVITMADFEEKKKQLLGL